MKKNKKQPTFASSFVGRLEYVRALRDGRKTRAVSEPPSRGKGSYKRKQKHRNEDY